MMDMVERVARAIYDRCNHWDYDGHLPDYDTLEEGGKAQWQEAARAAIEAMREPTPEMVAEGQRIYAYGPTATYVCMIDAVISTHARYRAMIDADLSKPLPSP